MSIERDEAAPIVNDPTVQLLLQEYATQLVMSMTGSTTVTDMMHAQYTLVQRIQLLIEVS